VYFCGQFVDQLKVLHAEFQIFLHLNFAIFCKTNLEVIYRYKAVSAYNLRFKRWLHFAIFYFLPINASEKGMQTHILLASGTTTQSLIWLLG